MCAACTRVCMLGGESTKQSLHQARVVVVVVAVVVGAVDVLVVVEVVTDVVVVVERAAAHLKSNPQGHKEPSLPQDRTNH